MKNYDFAIILIIFVNDPISLVNKRKSDEDQEVIVLEHLQERGKWRGKIL